MMDSFAVLNRKTVGSEFYIHFRVLFLEQVGAYAGGLKKGIASIDFALFVLTLIMAFS